MEISEDLLQLRQAGLDFEAAHQKRNWPSNFVSPIFWPNCNCLIFLGFSPKITPFHFCVSRNRVSKIYFALKTVKTTKLIGFRYKIQKTNLNKLSKPTFDRFCWFIDRFCRFINFLFFRIFLKIWFSLPKTGHLMKPGRTGFVENHIFVDKWIHE
jgi:hypothetical protein